MGVRTGGCVRSRAVVALLALALMATTAGCGARWSDDEREALLARSTGAATEDGTASGPTTGGRTAPGVTPSGGTPGTPTGGTTGGGGTGGTGGTGEGGATGGEGGPAGPAPCNAPSDAPGVSDTQLVVGSISSLSGPVPGLGASSEAAAQAYAAYRNSLGGVCGREVVLRTADDGSDNGRYRALVSDMVSTVLGIAGGLATGDAGGGEVVEANQMAVVNTPISEPFQNRSTVFDINPPFENVNAPTGKYRYLYDQGVRTASLIYIAQDQTRSEALGKHKPQMEAAGIRIVHEMALPLSTLSYDAPARAVANSKADFMLFVSEATTSASMAQALADIGYELKFEEYLIAYATNFIELAGDAAEGASTWIRSLPNEEQGNAEQAAFLEWMDRVAPGVPVDTFAADSWAGAKAFFDAVAALPGPISREALLTQLRGTATYDAGGFIGPIQLGPKLNNGCAIGLKVVSGEWRRMAPDQGFLC